MTNNDFKNWTEVLRIRRSMLLKPDMTLFKTASEVEMGREQFLSEYLLWRKEAERKGLLQKKAFLADAAIVAGSGLAQLTDAAVNLVKDVGLPALVAVPALMGMYFGYRRSKFTSPSEASLGNMQKQVVVDEYQQKVNELERERALKVGEQMNAPPPGRSVRALS